MRKIYIDFVHNLYKAKAFAPVGILHFYTCKMKLLKELFQQHQQYLTRRHFLKGGAMGIGAMALGNLMGCNFNNHSSNPIINGLNKQPHFDPKAKRIIFLHMAGAPSQLELFDYKPLLHQLDGQPCPDSLLKGKRFALSLIHISEPTRPY